MKTFAELIPELKEGKILIPVWNEHQVRVYQDDKDKAVFVTHRGFIVADSAQDFIEHAEEPSAKDDSDNEVVVKDLVNIPAWVAIDPTVPASIATGYTLFQLKEAAESGLPVSPNYCTDMPYCIEKSPHGFLVVTPSPCNDIRWSAPTFEELCARLFHSHIPFWMVGKSPAFLAIEEQFEREQEEEASLDAMPPRTIEVSEREYRYILSMREAKETLASVHDNDPFDPFLPDYHEDDKHPHLKLITGKDTLE